MYSVSLFALQKNFALIKFSVKKELQLDLV